MFIDPTLISWILILAASLCAFMIGRSWDKMNREEIIENNMAVLKCLDESFGTFNDVEIVEKSDEEAA